MSPLTLVDDRPPVMSRGWPNTSELLINRFENLTMGLDFKIKFESKRNKNIISC